MRTVLICHGDDVLNAQGLARWLASFTDLAGLVVLNETKKRWWQRVMRQVRRVGWLRFFDVLAFRIYYHLARRGRDRQWEEARLRELCRRYPPITAKTRVLHVSSPNSREAENFIRELAPDLMIARCKALLKPSVFSIPARGTFVMHPGICPEYRNAHGCFWALAHDDLSRVGMTLLRIDKGIDTGPVYGYFRCAYDEQNESHIVIQHRTVFDNLGDLQSKLLEINDGTARPIDTSGRESREWGQPWLTAYWNWQRKAQVRKRHDLFPALS